MNRIVFVCVVLFFTHASNGFPNEISFEKIPGDGCWKAS